MQEGTRVFRKPFAGAVAFAAFLLVACLVGCSAGGSSGVGGSSSGGDSATSESRYGTLRDFSTSTFDGSTFSSGDLANYDITIVNVWTTNCPYCIKEMPALELLYQQLPSNINFVSLCVDGDLNRATADEILSDANATFTVLCDSDSLDQCFVGYVSGVPTTVYVDKEGNIVGEPQVGAPSASNEAAIAEYYLEQAKDRLSQVA